MSESPLMIKSKAFALEVIRACKILREAKCESALINQFLRSGTSIVANIREAFYAHGKVDFVAKLHIALKECSETEYWLELNFIRLLALIVVCFHWFNPFAWLMLKLLYSDIELACDESVLSKCDEAERKE